MEVDSVYTDPTPRVEMEIQATSNSESLMAHQETHSLEYLKTSSLPPHRSPSGPGAVLRFGKYVTILKKDVSFSPPHAIEGTISMARKRQVGEMPCLFPSLITTSNL
jgi:hypothetical protein